MIRDLCFERRTCVLQQPFVQLSIDSAINRCRHDSSREFESACFD
jgi:hypothetical protein